MRLAAKEAWLGSHADLDGESPRAPHLLAAKEAWLGSHAELQLYCVSDKIKRAAKEAWLVSHAKPFEVTIPAEERELQKKRGR
jgi:hypothetical protein